MNSFTIIPPAPILPPKKERLPITPNKTFQLSPSFTSIEWCWWCGISNCVGFNDSFWCCGCCC